MLDADDVGRQVARDQKHAVWSLSLIHILSEFEESRKEEEGYQEVVVKHEVISTTDDYCTLKLMCYQAAGSGAEWEYYYTIDLKTGERLTLSDLFQSGADYITPISENIKEQMQQQMAEDDGKMYWVDNAEVPEWNFDKITDETSFYLDSDGHLVICFNEGDVAPMLSLIHIWSPREQSVRH